MAKANQKNESHFTYTNNIQLLIFILQYIYMNIYIRPCTSCMSNTTNIYIHHTIPYSSGLSSPPPHRQQTCVQQCSNTRVRLYLRIFVAIINNKITKLHTQTHTHSPLIGRFQNAIFSTFSRCALQPHQYIIQIQFETHTTNK